MANTRLDNQGNFWEFPPTCNMETAGPFHSLFVGCNNRDRGDINDGDYHWPGFTFGGPFPRKPYFCSSSTQQEPESGGKTTAGDPESQMSDNLNDPRTTQFVQAPPFFEHPNPWARAYGGGYQIRGGRGFHTGQGNPYGIGPMNWSGPWGSFGPSMNFGPWGGFGPWGNFGHWGGLPFWGNPRFTGGFGPLDSMGRGKFGPMDCFGNDENAAKVTTEPEFNVFETPTNYVVCVSLFGTNKAELKADLDLKKCELCIKGTIHRRGDRSFPKGLGQNEHGEFEHKLYLGNHVNHAQIQVDSITARMEDGILIVSIPKLISEHAEIKKVPVE